MAEETNLCLRRMRAEEAEGSRVGVSASDPALAARILSSGAGTFAEGQGSGDLFCTTATARSVQSAFCSLDSL